LEELRGQNKIESAVIEYTAILEVLPENHYSKQMVLISKIEVEKKRPWLQRLDDWEELVVCFKKIELDNLSKLKALPKSVL
jgi:hypothetical protein